MEFDLKKQAKEEFDIKKQVKNTGLLQSEELHNYILETSVYPREAEPLKELREATENHPKSFMAGAPIAGQMISFLLKKENAKKTIEVGVFTGYSLLLTALSIPDDGKITAIDCDREAYEIGLPFIKKAGVEGKIDFIESDAHLALDNLLLNPKNEGSFDFAFVDADKPSYQHYHERLIKLVKVGGVIAYDNTLWGGTVAMLESQVPDFMKEYREAIMKLNKSLAADPRIDIAQLPLGDGITFCRRLY
ncbi:caffeoyl-CoA O-methyltransferase-like [Chenopodium quinoa]|uniref:Caffeoyl-CoA O-methyltransferase n=1 Tax=Chenopodium quinoa TaxID=63459 RepID=A0A803MDC5_CHEQI|nr:caffeoyl-CoA O-methyltransferase-like [Chenopodium quinoa]XP_021751265.1 caffeoyl-CoA O-methyltransferase-like [Chenopodium quinoa]